MAATKFNQIIALLLVFTLLVIGIVYAAASEPSAPTLIENVSNTTTLYPNGSEMNMTRGYIYNINITESQPTQKWLGYVGNISGEYALQDASSNALYDWDIVTITGELYATKEYTAGDSNNYDNDFPSGGGVPLWGSLDCANSSMISKEEELWNHTSADEDSFSNTFKYTGFTNPTFYAGTTEIDNNVIGTDGGSDGTCYGANLNKNNQDSPESGNWSQVVLTDGTYQAHSSGEDDVFHFDIVYAVLLENNTPGFDGKPYDFQMLLPQSGLEGDQPNVAFYFFIELI